MSYSEKFQQIVEALNYDQNMQAACGAIKTQLVSEHDFLQHNPTLKTVYLTATDETQEGTFEDAFLQVTINVFSFKIPIVARLESCRVT